MFGDFLETEALELAAAGIVKEHKQIGVDDVAAVDFEFRIIDRALRDLQARGAGMQQAPVAPEREPDLVPLGAGGDVGQVETENIVSLDDIRISFLNDANHVPEQFALVPACEHGFPALIIGHRNSENAVALFLGIGKFAIGRIRLDIELEAVQVVECHLFEKSFPRGQEILVCGVIEGEAGKFLGGEPFARAGECVPIGEDGFHSVPVRVTGECRRFRFAVESAQCPVSRPEEGGELLQPALQFAR